MSIKNKKLNNFDLSNFCTPDVTYNFSLLPFVQKVVLLFLGNCNTSFKFSFNNIVFFSYCFYFFPIRRTSNFSRISLLIDLLFFYTFLIIYVCFMFLNPFFYCSSSFSKIFLTTRTSFLVYESTCNTTSKRVC